MTEPRRIRIEAGILSPRVLVAITLIVLAALTTGLTVFERGLFQDDAQVLLRTYAAPGGTMQALTLPITSATRRLQGSPYALALASGQPLLVLRVASELLTLAIGVLAALLGSYALRLPAAAAFAAGALTITASSDWLTASFVPIGYNLAIVLYLAGALALARWCRNGGLAWLAAALICGNASLWTVDAATILYPFTPLLAALSVDEGPARRRLMWGSLVWLAASVPYYVAFLHFIGSPGSYASSAIVAGTWPARAVRGAALVVLNFTPWEWAFWRRAWFPSPPSVIAIGTRVTLAIVGVAITAWVLWRLRRKTPAAVTPPAVALRRTLLPLAFVVLANAPYAAVHLSEFRYRTQLMSRVWAALAVAGVCAFLFERSSPWAKRAAAAIVLMFVGLGILGGLERQDYFLAYSRRHAAELGSIATAIPAIDARARVVLRLPPHPLYVATEAPYFARAWVTLLAADPSLECRTFLLSEARQATCSPDATALRCRRGDGSRLCNSLDARAPQELRYEDLIVLTYDAATNLYRLDAQLPAELRPPGDASARAVAAYEPAKRVIRANGSWIARSLR